MSASIEKMEEIIFELREEAGLPREEYIRQSIASAHADLETATSDMERTLLREHVERYTRLASALTSMEDT